MKRGRGCVTWKRFKLEIVVGFSFGFVVNFWVFFMLVFFF